jgi:hypothetical protein
MTVTFALNQILVSLVLALEAITIHARPLINATMQELVMITKAVLLVPPPTGLIIHFVMMVMFVQLLMCVSTELVLAHLLKIVRAPILASSPAAIQFWDVRHLTMMMLLAMMGMHVPKEPTVYRVHVLLVQDPLSLVNWLMPAML